MRRCFELAQKGQSRVAPNPMVGAVIVVDDKIIAEGFHEYFGGSHAEVNAIQKVKDKNLLKNASLYVNLEPCSHFGKTPPCANLIIEHKIPRVCIANLDPHDKVNGKGIQLLKAAGVDVKKGILEEEGHFLNRRFFTYHQKNRPYIILKWAETADAFISRNKKDIQSNNNWISNQSLKILSHQWRSEEAAILVGKNTVEIDNPLLTCRESKGQNPVRVILDRNLTLAKDSKIFNQDAPSIIFNQLLNKKEGIHSFIKLDKSMDELKQIMTYLREMEINSIIIEGGATVLNNFIKNGLWDEVRIIKTNKVFNSGIKAPIIKGRLISQEEIKDNRLLTYLNY